MEIRNRYNKAHKLIDIEELKNNPPDFPEFIEFLNELYGQENDHKLTA